MVQDFFDGVKAYPQAIKIMSNHRLWGYMLVPMLISIVLLIAFIALAVGVSGNISEWMANIYPWDFGKAWVDKVASGFGIIFVIAIGLILLKHIVMALASPFMSFLSETIEKKEYGREGVGGFSLKRMFSEMVRGIRIALRNIVRELSLTLLLFFLGIIPIFSPFVPFLIFFVQAYYAGFGSIDFTLERHFNVRGSVQFVRKNRGLAMGNGSIFLLLLMTGIGFLFALPLSTVAATTETLKRLD